MRIADERAVPPPVLSPQVTAGCRDGTTMEETRTMAEPRRCDRSNAASRSRRWRFETLQLVDGGLKAATEGVLPGKWHSASTGGRQTAAQEACPRCN